MTCVGPRCAENNPGAQAPVIPDTTASRSAPRVEIPIRKGEPVSRFHSLCRQAGSVAGSGFTCAAGLELCA